MDIIGSITSIKGVDLLSFFIFFGLFVLGFMQGTLRRLLGIASLILSLLIAAQLRAPFGDFLATNWTQYSPQYNHMLAFGSVFVAFSAASTVALQFFYKSTPLFAKYPAVDELLGGILGLVQGALILAAFYLITDPFFSVYGQIAQPNEFPFVRQIFDALQGSVTADVTRHTIVPFVLMFFGGIIPSDVTLIFSS